MLFWCVVPREMFSIGVYLHTQYTVHVRVWSVVNEWEEWTLPVCPCFIIYASYFVRTDESKTVKTVYEARRIPAPNIKTSNQTGERYKYWSGRKQKKSDWAEQTLAVTLRIVRFYLYVFSRLRSSFV